MPKSNEELPVPEYFVIFAAREESYSTVHHSDVLYSDGGVNVGDKVKFFWNREDVDGEVCFMDGELKNYLYLICFLNLLRLCNGVGLG